MSTSGGLYAAYGSNMDPEQMLQRCPHSPAAGAGWLLGWRLSFGAEEYGWDGSLPMLVPDADAPEVVPVLAEDGQTEGFLATNTAVDDLADAVHGERIATFVALYEMSPHDMESLDHWESADTGLYNRIRMRVSTLDGDVLAWVYVLDGYEGGLPSARSIGLISDAAEAAGAPEEYVTALRARPCRSLGE